jgi:hypothetical protein
LCDKISAHLKNKKIIQSLIGHSNLSFYLECLGTLLDNSADQINLLLHGDGTLTDNDSELIDSKLGKACCLINSNESKETTLDQLVGYSNCQHFRKESIWGIEFFDPLFSRPNDQISFYLDADIMFTRPFSGLFKPSIVEGGAVFLSDKQWDAYCLRPWHLIGSRQCPKIVRGITTALVCWDKKVIDWDYLEWFLGQTNFHTIPEWVLPTAQAGLATLCRAKTVSHEQLPNLYPKTQITSDAFGVHLLGSYRKDWLPRIKEHQLQMNDDTKPIVAKFEACQNRGVAKYALNQGKRWINTRLNRW